MLHRSQSLAVFLMALFFCLIAHAEPVMIGSSSSPEATAYNNARRIARTSDDELVVVFQDIADGPQIMLCRRPSKGTWQEPLHIGDGMHPAITVAEDTVFIVWTLPDSSGIALANGDLSTIREIRPHPEALCLFPSVEYSGDLVDVVWQQKSLATGKTHIGHQAFSAELQPDESTPHPVLLCPEVQGCYYPILVGNLFYEESEPSFHHVFWSQLDFMGDSPYKIGHLTLLDGMTSEPSHIDMPGLQHPSVSCVHDQFLMAAHDLDRNGFVVALFMHDFTGNLFYQESSFHPTQGLSWPSVDDIYMPSTSAALVWQDNNSILYSQTRKAEITTDPPIVLSSQMARYPSVAYKMFRADSFDVVWTEGDEPPFRVMYNRYKKQYQPLKITTASLPVAFLGKRYETELQSTGGIHQHFWDMTADRWPKGLMRAQNTIYGTPEIAGDFNLNVVCWDGYPSSQRDSVSFVLTITSEPPVITSPGDVTAKAGEEFIYKATATDPDGNAVFFTFENFPAWLEADGNQISGQVPQNPSSFKFDVTASDGGYSQTMTVVVSVIEAAVDSEEKALPNEYFLYQNYPNPFNPETFIRFDLPTSGHVRVEIFDLQGNAVSLLLSQRLQPGQHIIRWNSRDSRGRRLSSGIYYLKMTAGDFVDVKRVVLLR